MRVRKNKDPVSKLYEPPKLTVYGDVRKITAGNSTGAFTDASFPTGTAFSDLTFSG